MRKTTISSRINELCAIKDMNLKQLSAISGIKYTTLNNYATGIRTPQIDTLCALCEATETDLNWMVGY